MSNFSTLRSKVPFSRSCNDSARVTSGSAMTKIGAVPFQQKRANKRQRFYYKASLSFADQQHDCIIWDISCSGARLSAEIASDLPDTFEIVLTKRGNVRRLCRVQWRFDNQLGIRFVTKSCLPGHSPTPKREIVVVD